MNIKKIKPSLSLQIVSYLYLIFTILAIPVIIVFPVWAPEFLFFFGAKSYLYIFFNGFFGIAFGNLTSTLGWLFMGIAAILFVATIGLFIYALVKKHYQMLFVITVADISLALVFCLIFKLNPIWTIVFNVAYCLWLFCFLLRIRRRQSGDDGEKI